MINKDREVDYRLPDSKDEVALIKKNKKLDIEPIIKSVVDDFNNIYKLKKELKFLKSDGKKNIYKWY